MKEFIIQDAETFYTCIKANKLYTDLNDKDVIAALDSYFLERYKAANADNRRGVKRDKYIFFQGMLAGCLVAYKQIRHHVASEAYNQGIDPLTGEKFKNGNKDN